MAFLAAFVLVGESLFGGVQLCALAGLVVSDCCESPCADEGDQASAADAEGASIVAVQSPHDAGGSCSCPFDCAFGCCSAKRVTLVPLALLNHTLVESEQLDFPHVEEAPPSPDARGILHVPKRTV